MGYTHYIRGPRTITPALVKDVQDIIAVAATQGIVIAGWDGTGSPIVSTDEIRLNGLAPELDHETLVISPEATGFAFCKTARKPYDAVVCAILIRTAELNPGLEVSSDGDWNEEDEWSIGKVLYTAALGHPPTLTGLAQ